MKVKKEERPEGRNVGEPWAISPGLESQGPRGGGGGPEARGGAGLLLAGEGRREWAPFSASTYRQCAQTDTKSILSVRKGERSIDGGIIFCHLRQFLPALYELSLVYG
jgi:hypothetical protein